MASILSSLAIVVEHEYINKTKSINNSLFTLKKFCREMLKMIIIEKTIKWVAMGILYQPVFSIKN